jgi:hypothetical protein
MKDKLLLDWYMFAAFAIVRLAGSIFSRACSSH